MPATTDGGSPVATMEAFTLDPQGAVPVVFHALSSAVTAIANGFNLTGTVTIDVPGNQPITLLEANITLQSDPSKGDGLQSFSGTVRLPFPDIGFMSSINLAVADPIYASVGYDLGSNLTQVDAPLLATRKYLYFTFSAGLSATLGSMSISGPGGQSVTMTIDPSDPSFYLKAALSGLMGPVEDASVGFSIGGNLPFTPDNTWGIDQNIASFNGHIWLGGHVDLNDLKVPLAIGGNTVVNIDPDKTGQTFFTNPSEGFEFGSNSEVDASIQAKAINFQIPIATATIIGRVSSSDVNGYYSGKVSAGNSWMPPQVPLKNLQQLLTAGHFSSANPGQSYITAQGNLALDATVLGQWTGLSLSDLAMATATLNANSSGVNVTGTASGSFSPYVGLNGNVNVAGFFDGTPADWHVTLDGDLAVSSIDLSAAAHAQLDSTGMTVKGSYATPLTSVAMSGSVTSTGVDIEGSATVSIPIVAGKQVVQQIVNAAVCGYTTVTDAGICGEQTITDAAKCGTTAVTDAAKCGTTAVTDAAKCGTTTVTSAAECGVSTITSAAECGVSTFSDIAHCGLSCVESLFSSCSCSAPNSCTVANSCSVAATCNIPSTCNIPNTCTVPKSCQIPATCNQTVTVPDFNYGTFDGSITLTIGTSGLSGSVEGSYCATGSSCVPLAGGRLNLSNGKPEACITIDGLGEFCAPF